MNPILKVLLKFCPTKNLFKNFFCKKKKNNTLLAISQWKFSPETCKNFSFFIMCVKFKSLNAAF